MLLNDAFFTPYVAADTFYQYVLADFSTTATINGGTQIAASGLTLPGSGTGGGTSSVFSNATNGLVPGPSAVIPPNYYLAADGTWKSIVTGAATPSNVTLLAMSGDTLRAQVDGTTTLSVSLAQFKDGRSLSVVGNVLRLHDSAATVLGSVTLPSPPVFSGGATGTVPAATAADATKVLTGAGTWISPATLATSIPVFTGTVTGTVPTATAADATKVLSGAGTWITPASAVSVFAGSATGTVPAALATDSTKVLTGAGTWVAPLTLTPTFAGSTAGLVPNATATDASKLLKGDGTWVAPNAIVPVFAGSSAGMVPAATAADATKVLTGAGTWVAPSTLATAIPVFAGNVTGTVPGATAADAAKFLSGAGTWLTPAAPASTITKFIYDAVGKKIVLAIDGGADSILSVAALDDEGATLAFNSGNLEMRNSAGTIISTTPIPDLDAQTLSLTGTTLSISGGNSVTLPASPAAQLLSLVGDELYLSGGNFVNLKTVMPNDVTTIVTGTGLLRTIAVKVNGKTSTAVSVPDTWQNLSYDQTTRMLSIDNGNTMQLPKYAGVTPGFVPEPPAAPAAGLFLQADGAWTTAVKTVVSTLSGTGASRAISIAVNGVASSAVVIGEQVPQVMSLSGSTLTLSGGGGTITLPSAPVIPTYIGTSVAGLVPAAPATIPGRFLAADGSWQVPPAPTLTNTLAASKAAGFVSTVGGTAGTLAVNNGTIVDVLGFTAAGTLVWQAGLTPQDFFRQSATNALPDGTNDLTDNVYRTGKTSFGSTNVPRCSVDTLSLAVSMKGISANYTTTLDDHTIRVQSGTGITITIHDAQNSTTGQHLTLINSTANPVNITGQTVFTHYGSILTILPANSTYMLHSESNSWYVVGSYGQNGYPIYSGVGSRAGLVPAAPTVTPATKVLYATGWADLNLPITTSINWSKGVSLNVDVNGSIGGMVINAGTVVDFLGYNAAGNVVHQAITIGAASDFWRQTLSSALPNGTGDPAKNITRTGNVGVNVTDPVTSLHTTSFAAAHATINSGAASTSLQTHTFRWGLAAPANSTLTLHSAATATGQIMVLLNNSPNPQPLAGVPVKDLATNTITSIPSRTSFTVQSFGTFEWVIIDTATYSDSAVLPVTSKYKTTAGNYTVLDPVITAGTVTVETFIEVTAFATITLPNMQTTDDRYSNLDFVIKATGAWGGNVTVAAPVGQTIDGGTTATIVKPVGATNQPSMIVRYIGGSRWLICRNGA